MQAACRTLKNHTKHDQNLKRNYTSDLSKKTNPEIRTRLAETWLDKTLCDNKNVFCNNDGVSVAIKQYIFVATEVTAVLAPAIIMATKFTLVANDVCFLWLNERLP